MDCIVYAEIVVISLFTLIETCTYTKLTFNVIN